MSAETSIPTCYRHNDRETRLHCTRCGRPICVECLHRADVGQRCPECAAADTQRVVRADELGGASGAPVATGLVVAGVVVFVLGYVPELAARLYFYGLQANELVAAGQWWRLLTAAFLHDGLAHILFNMWALWALGTNLERQVGSLPFAFLYLASALAGGLAFYATVPGGRALGASGAVFGLFGVWLVSGFRRRKTAAGQAGFRQMLGLLVLNLALPVFVPGIAWQAHLGGLVAGGLVGAGWLSTPLRGRHAGRRTALAASMASVLLALVLLVA